MMPNAQTAPSSQRVAASHSLHSSSTKALRPSSRSNSPTHEGGINNKEVPIINSGQRSPFVVHAVAAPPPTTPLSSMTRHFNTKSTNNNIHGSAGGGSGESSPTASTHHHHHLRVSSSRSQPNVSRPKATDLRQSASSSDSRRAVVNTASNTNFSMMEPAGVHHYNNTLNKRSSDGKSSLRPSGSGGVMDSSTLPSPRNSQHQQLTRMSSPNTGLTDRSIGTPGDLTEGLRHKQHQMRRGDSHHSNVVVGAGGGPLDSNAGNVGGQTAGRVRLHQSHSRGDEDELDVAYTNNNSGAAGVISGGNNNVRMDGGNLNSRSTHTRDASPTPTASSGRMQGPGTTRADMGGVGGSGADDGNGAVTITLHTTKDDFDEKAEVRVELSNPALVVEKMLQTLAHKFPPESVVTITSQSRTNDGGENTRVGSQKMKTSGSSNEESSEVDLMDEDDDEEDDGSLRSDSSSSSGSSSSRSCDDYPGGRDGRGAKDHKTLITSKSKDKLLTQQQQSRNLITNAAGAVDASDRPILQQASSLELSAGKPERASGKSTPKSTQRYGNIISPSMAGVGTVPMRLSGRHYLTAKGDYVPEVASARGDALMTYVRDPHTGLVAQVGVQYFAANGVPVANMIVGADGYSPTPGIAISNEDGIDIRNACPKPFYQTVDGRYVPEAVTQEGRPRIGYAVDPENDSGKALPVGPEFINPDGTTLKGAIRAADGTAISGIALRYLPAVDELGVQQDNSAAADVWKAAASQSHTQRQQQQQQQQVMAAHRIPSTHRSVAVESHGGRQNTNDVPAVLPLYLRTDGTTIPVAIGSDGTFMLGFVNDERRGNRLLPVGNQYIDNRGVAVSGYITGPDGSRIEGVPIVAQRYDGLTQRPMPFYDCLGEGRMDIATNPTQGGPMWGFVTDPTDGLVKPVGVQFVDEAGVPVPGFIADFEGLPIEGVAGAEEPSSSQLQLSRRQQQRDHSQQQQQPNFTITPPSTNQTMTTTTTTTTAQSANSSSSENANMSNVQSPPAMMTTTTPTRQLLPLYLTLDGRRVPIAVGPDNLPRVGFALSLSDNIVKPVGPQYFNENGEAELGYIVGPDGQKTAGIAIVAHAGVDSSKRPLPYYISTDFQTVGGGQSSSRVLPIAVHPIDGSLMWGYVSDPADGRRVKYVGLQYIGADGFVVSGFVANSEGLPVPGVPVISMGTWDLPAGLTFQSTATSGATSTDTLFSHMSTAGGRIAPALTRIPAPGYPLADGSVVSLAVGPDGRPLDGYIQDPKDGQIVPVGVPFIGADGRPVPDRIEGPDGKPVRGRHIAAYAFNGISRLAVPHYLTVSGDLLPMALGADGRLVHGYARDKDGKAKTVGLQVFGQDGRPVPGLVTGPDGMSVRGIALNPAGVMSLGPHMTGGLMSSEYTTSMMLPGTKVSGVTTSTTTTTHAEQQQQHHQQLQQHLSGYHSSHLAANREQSRLTSHQGSTHQGGGLPSFSGQGLDGDRRFYEDATGRHSIISSTVIAAEGGAGPDEYEVRYVEVPVYEEKVIHVARKEYIETIKNVPKYEYEIVERVVEIPKIEYVERAVEVLQYVDVVKEVKVKKQVDVPVEITRTVPKIETRIIEKTVERPGEIIEVPKPYTVETKVVVPEYIDHEIPTVVAQKLQPTIKEANTIREIDCLVTEPNIITVDVFIPKAVTTSLEAYGKVSESHQVVDIPAAQYNSLVNRLNNTAENASHIESLFVTESGSVPMLPIGERIETVEPVSSDWVTTHQAGMVRCSTKGTALPQVFVREKKATAKNVKHARHSSRAALVSHLSGQQQQRRYESARETERTWVTTTVGGAGAIEVNNNIINTNKQHHQMNHSHHHSVPNVPDDDEVSTSSASTSSISSTTNATAEQTTMGGRRYDGFGGMAGEENQNGQTQTTRRRHHHRSRRSHRVQRSSQDEGGRRRKEIESEDGLRERSRSRHQRREPNERSGEAADSKKVPNLRPQPEGQIVLPTSNEKTNHDLNSISNNLNTHAESYRSSNKLPQPSADPMAVGGAIILEGNNNGMQQLQTSAGKQHSDHGRHRQHRRHKHHQSQHHISVTNTAGGLHSIHEVVESGVDENKHHRRHHHHHHHRRSESRQQGQDHEATHMAVTDTKQQHRIRA